MFRAKTVKNGPRKPTILSQDPEPEQRNTNAVSTENMLSALLDAESEAAIHRPWLRLERGLRMRLLRTYVESQTEFNPYEKVDLLKVLIDAVDNKTLNSKSQISYNQEDGVILEIPSLKVIKGEKTTFRIEPPNRGTKKVKRTNNTDSD